LCFNIKWIAIHHGFTAQFHVPDLHTPSNKTIIVYFIIICVKLICVKLRKQHESVLLGNYDPKAPRGIVEEAIKKKSTNKEDTEESGSGKTVEAGLNKETAESILGSPEEK